MRKATAGAGIGVGGASILVIFVLLCLTTFAGLSLVSANADLTLTQKTAEALTRYYRADTAAEELLAQVDSCLAGVGGQGREAYWDGCEAALAPLAGQGVTTQREEHGLTVRYSVPAGEQSALQVALEVVYPPAPTRLARAGWTVVNTGAWEEDDSIPLWDGGIP